MNCIKKIANDAKVIEIDNQMLVLIKRQVETNLMLEEKFRDPYEEVSNFVKEIKDVVKEVERLSCKDVAKETVCLLRRGQKESSWYMRHGLQMMVDESSSVREKLTFVKIAKDANVIEIDNQLLVLIKRQVETKLMLEEKFRDPYEEVSNFVKEIKDVVKEVERLSCKDVAKETVCLLRRGQKRELYMMTRLQMMVDESHLSVHEKHTFVTLIVGASPSCDVQLPCKKKIPNLDPPAGIFANHLRSLFECDFVSLDSRLNSKNPLWITHLVPRKKLIMLGYCSLAMVCFCVVVRHGIFYYVYNPFTNLFKRLPQSNYYLRDDSCFFSSGVFRLAFDPRKLRHYKVVQAGGEADETWIQIYSSETGN
ncbi:hypothetical protein Tco_0974355 [Tanacetum coccineum]|uniref:Uncharacterized protein n=1 Tax=Tanacetum coccineum TaxID=301880 RepID=A0ABQ5EBB5_9ASTR